jgi:hypothetical protein
MRSSSNLERRCPAQTAEIIVTCQDVTPETFPHTENAKDANGGSYADQTSAHEVGHQVGLAFQHRDSGFHDIGSTPNNNAVEALMKSGAPVNGQITTPTGRWIRHEDWEEANRRAQTK